MKRTDGKHMKVLVSDTLAQEGLEILNAAKGLEVDYKPGLSEDELCEQVADAEALIIRSGTTVTERVLDAAKNLKWIGRAGIGVDNVDVPAASKSGVIVSNTPTGNMVTTAEHAISLMCALTRQIPQATASMKAGKWEKKIFKGRELFNKNLGVVGLGNIGKIVADRAQGLKMKILGYDPFVSKEKAASLGIELVDLEELCKRADFITVHTPLNDATRGIVGKDAFAVMKKGVLLVQASRGGVVDEDALLEALNNGTVAGAALDVFVQEPTGADHPLVNHPNVICTPHLGAATFEAQLNVAVQVAEQCVDYLVNGEIRNAINIPAVPAEQVEQLQPYLTLAEKLGLFHAQLRPEGFDHVEIELMGEVAGMESKPVTLAALKGLLSPIKGNAALVNYVNAPVIAAEQGITVRESSTKETHDYTSHIRIRTRCKDGKEYSVEGAVFNVNDQRIVGVDGYRVEVIPSGTLLALKNEDLPGVVGGIGCLLAEENVNIASMQMGRDAPGGTALAFLSIDAPASPETLKKLEAVQHVLRVKQITL